jgi:hypothetical protein
MHPIERLRYVARASGADQGLLVRESAGALASFADDPHGLVVACRRIIDRHPTSAPLWWLCSRLLTADDGYREAWRAVEELERDQTARHLASALPEGVTVCALGWPEHIAEALVRRGDLDVLVVDVLGEGSGLVRRLVNNGADAFDVPQAGLGQAVVASDVVLLEASAVGPGELLAVTGSLAAAAVARHRGTDVWMAAGVGRVLPARVWDAMQDRLALACPDAWEADDELMTLGLIDRVVGPNGPETPADTLRRADCPVAPELFGGSSF